MPEIYLHELMFVCAHLERGVEEGDQRRQEDQDAREQALDPQRVDGRVAMLVESGVVPCLFETMHY